MTECLRILIHISNYFQTLENIEKTLSDKNEPKNLTKNLAKKHFVPKCRENFYTQFQYAMPLYLRTERYLIMELNPFRTAVSFWGQSTQISSTLSPHRDCGSKRVKNDVFGVEERGWSDNNSARKSAVHPYRPFVRVCAANGLTITRNHS